MITKLHIENFKGFEQLDLRDISRITLIGGRNNVGKTSLLESIFLFYDIGDPGVFARLLNWRGMDAVSTDANTLIAPIFRNFNMEHQIKVVLRDNIYDCDMEVSFDFANTQKSINVDLSSGTSPSVISQDKADQFLFVSYAVNIIYRIGGLKEQKIRLVVKQGLNNLTIQFEPGPSSGFPELMMKGAAFFGLKTRTDPGEDAMRYGQLDVEKNSEQILDFVRLIEPNLIELSSVAFPQKSVIHADIGMSHKIPVPYMGDGVSRLLSIILAIATIKKGIILIDEIDAGIHYSVLPKIWEGICRAAQTFNCQIITTTHSYECLQAAYDGTAAAGISDEFCYFRLDHIKNDIIAKRYSHEALGAALQNGWEVR